MSHDREAQYLPKQICTVYIKTSMNPKQAIMSGLLTIKAAAGN